MLYSKKYIKEIQNKNQFKFKKKFGQNFIIDENTIKKIIKKSEIDKDTLVIEIGPGIGSLTYYLCKYAKNVLCYEIDTTLKEFLDQNLKIYNNIEIKYQDFLKSNVIRDIKDYKYKKLYIIANLPYYITTPILIKLIEDKINVDKIIVMVQKEVGDRLKAVPKTKDYNSLTIFINYYFNVKKIVEVSKNIFIPVPNVDSIVLEFTKNEKNYKVKDENLFFNLVRDSFVQKRKTIKNNLNNYDLEKIEKVLISNNFTLNTRAEEIKIEVFVEIANRLAGD